MLAKRIIPCLSVANGRVQNGVQFRDMVDAGDPVECAERYEIQGADELVLLDITATTEGRKTFTDMVLKSSDKVFMPLTVGGGITSVEDMTQLMKAGADKISINTAAMANPALITEGAQKFGNQGIVVCLDVKYNPFEKVWYAYGHGATGESGQHRNALEWAKEAVERGAGELLVTSIDRHGTGLGFDIELYQALAEVVDVPVTAFGGAGNVQHFVDLFTKTNVTGALAGVLLHNKVLTIKDIKKALHEAGIVVRL